MTEASVAEQRERDIYGTIFKVLHGLLTGLEDVPAVPTETYQRLLALLRAAHDVAGKHCDASVQAGAKDPQQAFPFMDEIRRQ